MSTSAAPVTDLGPIDKLVERAETLAGAWSARAQRSTTVGQERAILRLFGVTGLDRSGRPLAGAAVDRWLAGAHDGLGGGIGLPFAMALIEYDLDPQQLALDVASGAVDLALEAELLAEHDRRAMAETEATRLVATAIDRIDADRTARRELIDLLGDARRPWLGTSLGEPDLHGALDEAAELAMAGFDVLRVEVPIGRELAARMHDAGMDVPEWQPRERGGRAAVEDREDGELAPAGSQRALARLRHIADGVAAERRGYVRLATAIPPLGIPEAAVVAAFERVDIVEADPITEIVAGGVHPDRSLADHTFARRFYRRSDTYISIGPGPLVVAPDLASGVPAATATRSGRALALQLVSVALARAEGIAPERIMVGAYPAWLGDERSATSRILAELALRRALYPDLSIRFDEPGPETRGATAWPFLVAAVLGTAGERAVVMRRRNGDPARTIAEARAAAAVAADLGAVSAAPAIGGEAAEHARATVVAAVEVLERLADRGWRAVVGEPLAHGERATASRGRRDTIGGDAVAERTESFDPLAQIGPRSA